MQLLGILIELRGEGAANAGIYRYTCRSRASSIFVLHAPYKVTRPSVRHSPCRLRQRIARARTCAARAGVCVRDYAATVAVWHHSRMSINSFGILVNRPRSRDS